MKNLILISSGILSVVLLILTGCGGGTGTTEPEEFAIYDVVVQTTSSSAVISLKTTHPAKCWLDYDLIGNEIGEFINDTLTYKTEFTFNLLYLISSEDYYFNLLVTDEENLTATYADTFTTSAKTTDEPIVYGLTISNITAISAVISWYTDEPSDSRVFYGLSTAYTDSTYDTTEVISHQLTLSGLTSQTQYYFRAASDDAESFRGFSQDSSFTTTNFVFVSIPDTVVSANSDFNYPLTLSNVSDLAAMQFQIEFDPVYLSVDNIIAGPFVIDNDYLFFDVGVIDNIAGTAFVSIAWKTIIQGDLIIGTHADGAGVAAYIQFHADAPGTTIMTFNEDETLLLDPYFQQIPGSLDDAIIVIQ